MIFRSFQNIVRHFGPKKNLNGPPNGGLGEEEKGVCISLTRKGPIQVFFFRQTYFLHLPEGFLFIWKMQTRNIRGKWPAEGHCGGSSVSQTRHFSVLFLHQFNQILNQIKFYICIQEKCILFWNIGKLSCA